MEWMTFDVLLQWWSFWLVAFMFYYYVTSISKQLEKNNEAINKLTETLSILMDRINRSEK
jgi:TM2 domain-containing membrane protein YozV